MKKFICLFPTGENIVLIKDVGMIPFYMYKDGHYDAYISFYKSEEELAYLSSDLKGLKYVQMKNIFNNEVLNTFFFLIRNLYKYDVIMLFHPSPYKVLMANVIKWLTFNKTKFYFKVDFDMRSIDQILYTGSLLSRVKKFINKRIDLFSAESKEGCRQLNERSYYHNVAYIPNGSIVSEHLSTNLKKEKIFLTVSRLGTYAKNTETLMEAFAASSENTDWKLLLVGPVEHTFKVYLGQYFERYPWALERVEMLGEVYDRKELNRIYRKSSVFILSSRYESFGLVLLEAMMQGCYILSTELPSSKDILKDESLGRTFPVEDFRALANLMSGVVDKSVILPTPEHIRQYVVKNYSWSIVVEKIASYLKSDYFQH